MTLFLMFVQLMHDIGDMIIRGGTVLDSFNRKAVVGQR
jgi:hypothetical protein